MSFLILILMSAAGDSSFIPVHAEDGKALSEEKSLSVFQHERLSDEELSVLRGGFRLPNGVDVALTVQSQTAIDGATVLRTVFQADQGAPQFTVYVPKSGEKVAAPFVKGISVGPVNTALNAPTVRFDSRSGVQISQNYSAPSVALTIGIPNGQTNAGLERVSADGLGVATDNGMVSQSSKNGILRAQLQSSDITIQHLAGNAFGSAVVNSGSDRMIDTQTSVNIELANVGALILQSAALRVDSVVSDALRNRN